MQCFRPTFGSCSELSCQDLTGWKTSPCLQVREPFLLGGLMGQRLFLACICVLMKAIVDLGHCIQCLWIPNIYLLKVFFFVKGAPAPICNESFCLNVVFIFLIFMAHVVDFSQCSSKANYLNVVLCYVSKSN